MPRRDSKGRLSSSEGDDFDLSDDVYVPVEEEDSDDDSDFDTPALTRKKSPNHKFELTFDDDLPPIPEKTKAQSRPRIKSTGNTDNSNVASKRFNFNLEWDDEEPTAPSKTIKMRPPKRNAFDSSDESESEDQPKKKAKQSIMTSIIDEYNAERKKGVNKQGILDVLNDEYYPKNRYNTVNKKLKTTDKLEFSDSEDDDEDQDLTQGTSSVRLLTLKDLPTSSSESESEEDGIDYMSKLKRRNAPDKDSKVYWFKRFDKKVRKKVEQEFPTFNTQKITKVVGEMWRDLSEDNKKEFSKDDILSNEEPTKKKKKFDAALLRKAYFEPKRTNKKKDDVSSDIPKRPSGNGYILYSTHEMPKVRKQHPDIISVNDLSSIVGAHWRGLAQEKRDEYNAIAKRERDEWIRKYPEAHERYLERMKKKIRDTKKVQRANKELVTLRNQAKKQRRSAMHDEDSE